ncbi:MAG: DUF6352 family protein [Caldimonas sp.]
MPDLWPASGYRQLRRDDRGWLVATDDYLRLFLDRPELAVVAESCPAERRLAAALRSQPSATVDATATAAIVDDDARENYRLFLRFRDALLAAGTLEAWYLDLFRSGSIDIPPLFVDRVAEAIVHNVVEPVDDVYVLRAAELLYRPQRIAIDRGQVLAADMAAVDLLCETGGFGDIGRLLVQNQAPMSRAPMEVLDDANAPRFLAQSGQHAFLLDLSHEIGQDLGHGLSFTMTRARSGLKALARVLERWIGHFFGVAVSVVPMPRIDDPAWAWHVGLDAESTALLNELYLQGSADPAREERLIGLFRLTFADPSDMRADLAGKPVYLGLAMNAERTLKLKPQNLLVNLPLAARI